MNRLFPILILLLFFISCNKSVDSYNPDFVGYWKSDVYTDFSTGTEGQSFMIIGKDQNEFGLLCEPNCLTCSCVNFVEGRAQVNTDKSKIRIGHSNLTITLTINDEPYLNTDSIWVCKLDDVEYFKQ